MERLSDTAYKIIGNTVLSFSESTIDISGPNGHMTVLTSTSDVIVRKEHAEWLFYYVVDLSTPNVLTRPFPAKKGNYEKTWFDHENDIVIDCKEKDTSWGSIIIDRSNPHVLTRADPIMMEDDPEHIKEISEKENIMRDYIKEMDEEAVPFGCSALY